MKTRTLFFTLLISISILLITSGLALADPITGCVRNGTGAIYNAQIGTEPKQPCNFLDEQITWSEEGPQGPPGENGEDGQDGQDGTIIHQVHLVDSDNLDCENGTIPPSPSDTFGWCPNGTKDWFIIQDSMVNANSVIIITQEGVPSPVAPIGVCVARFINTALGSFNITCGIPTANGVRLNYAIINP